LALATRLVLPRLSVGAARFGRSGLHRGAGGRGGAGAGGRGGAPAGLLVRHRSSRGAWVEVGTSRRCAPGDGTPRSGSAGKRVPRYRPPRESVTTSREVFGPVQVGGEAAGRVGGAPFVLTHLAHPQACQEVH